MTYWETILLGLVQGIAEFLPISSDGHLVLAQALLGRKLDSLELEIALHFATLMSIILVYWQELWQLRRQPRLVLAIVIATIPVGFVGFFLKDRIEATFASPVLAGWGLLVTAALLFFSMKLPEGTREATHVRWQDALVIGLFQTVAPLPGVSRSGSTIVGGILSGLQRRAATSFSFLIAIPAIGGATLLKAKDVWEQGGFETPIGPLLAGMLTAFLVGILSLKSLIRVVAAGRLAWFAWYCLAVGLVTIAVCR